MLRKLMPLTMMWATAIARFGDGFKGGDHDHQAEIMFRLVLP